MTVEVLFSTDYALRTNGYELELDKNIVTSILLQFVGISFSGITLAMNFQKSILFLPHSLPRLRNGVSGNEREP